jgi:hypothetical protein
VAFWGCGEIVFLGVGGRDKESFNCWFIGEWALLEACEHLRLEDHWRQSRSRLTYLDATPYSARFTCLKKL